MAVTDVPTGPLYSQFAEDPDLAELVDVFVEEMPRRVATLLDRLEQADWDSLGRAAHQLKGAAGSYGFGEISVERRISIASLYRLLARGKIKSVGHLRKRLITMKEIRRFLDL